MKKRTTPVNSTSKSPTFPRESQDSKDKMPPAEPPAQSTASVNQLQLLWALLQFALSSVGMMLGNKLAVIQLPLPCTLVIIQVIGTLVLLAFCRSQIQPLRADIVQQWIPVALLFTLMIFTSLKTFVYVSVSTVIIFRNVGAILTTVVEYLVRGVTVNIHVIISELIIVAGAVMYAHGSVDFNWVGLFWIFVNVGGQVAYGVVVKSMMDKPGFKEMSKYTMSFYNNLLALPMLFVVLFLQGEQHSVQEKLEAVDGKGWFTIAVTCFLGFLISTSGFGLQKLVSATSFLVINNLTKFLNIGLGMIYLSDKIAGPVDAGGCLLALFGGFRYSQAMMALNDAKAANASNKKDAATPVNALGEKCEKA